MTDGHLLAPGFDEPFIRQLRVAMRGAGIPVEASKAEAWPGQHEITFRYGDPLTVADNHVIYKHGAKEIADQNGRSITFMAKPDHRWIGSSCHVHTSLWQDGRNAFEGESDVFRHFLAGQVACVGELAVFVAPAVNSYKRFVGKPAPGRATPSPGRTTTARPVSASSAAGSALRVEARIPGADVQPLPRLRGPARGRPSRHRAPSSSRRRPTRATPTRRRRATLPARPSARRSRRSSRARWPGPPSATPSSTTT